MLVNRSIDWEGFLMNTTSISISAGFSGGVGFITLIVLVVLHWLHIPAGTFVDWFVGIASFYWLLAIVTIPWNIFFTAKTVLVEANMAKDRQIFVDKKQIQYAQKVSRWGLIIAIGLHLISSAVLYGLAASGISAIGYISAAATLLFTVMRPGLRAYEYIATRLGLIQDQLYYPREDVVELRERLTIVENRLKELTPQFDGENTDSFIYQNQQELTEMRQRFATLKANTEEELAQNRRASEQLVAQLTEDSQFLLHARELIRFFKEA